MSRFEIDQKVYVVENGVLKPGTIHTVYESLGYALVRFDNDELQKVMFERIAVMPEEKETEKPSEPVLKSEITITQNEFMEIGSRISAEIAYESDVGFEMMGIFARLLAMMHIALFVEGPDDDTAV